MTRVNMIDPTKLTDQHLNAERLELNLVVASARRSFNSKHGLRTSNKFTLNSGHVIFFHNRLGYIHRRFDILSDEMRRRGMNPVKPLMDTSWAPSSMFGDYDPNDEDFGIIKHRILQKIQMKPTWYKYCGAPISDEFMKYYLGETK
jgi:deoxyribonuclease (pyrimidine dimer)